MTEENGRVEVGPATEEDLDGILALQAANQAENGGMLSAAIPRARLLAMMDDMPIVVAKQSSRVIGFLMASRRSVNADIPIVREMLAAYPGCEDAYLYGPICVGNDMRGQGIAQAMAAALRRLHPEREGILFIRRDNAPSLRAHGKMGLREVASFEFGGIEHGVFSYRG